MPEEYVKKVSEKDAIELKEVQGLSEKYVGFSSELLRISLLGIALLGFFIDKMLDNHSFTEFWKSVMFFGLAIGAVFFAISAYAALSHRYYISEAGFYLIRLLLPEVKSLPKCDGVPVSPKVKDDESPAEPVEYAKIPDLQRKVIYTIWKKDRPKSDDQSMFDSCGKLAAWFIGFSSFCAGLATFCVIVTGILGAIGYCKNPPQQKPPISTTVEKTK